MLVVAFMQWWYGPGWRDAAGRLRMRIVETYMNFSVPILLTTLFAPWRRIISPGGGSLQQRSRAMLDNTISRVVGLSVRLIALLSAAVIIAIYAILGGLMLILWPLIPILGPALIVGGLF